MPSTSASRPRTLPFTPPSWLPSAFSRAALGVGADAPAPAIAREGKELLERWMEPSRRYHNVRHLVDLLERIDELQQETHSPHAMRLAAWYHGAIFDAEAPAAYARRGGEDEAASAEYAREHLGALGVPDDAIDEVAEMVSALARHAPNGRKADCGVLCDADLAILAAEPQRYRAYADDIRAEYVHIPVRDYLETRRSILKKLISRERLYVSPLAAPWEPRARQNVAAELQRIDSELAGLESSAD
jgi:predicted metal-dependent HD superfamily phosphohydrolase